MSTETDTREEPALRDSAEIDVGDIVHTEDFVAEYGVVSRVDPIWIDIPVRGLEIRATALSDYQLVDVDEVLGTDTVGATHLLDRDAQQVIVMQLADDQSEHFEAHRYDVGPREIGKYLHWVESRHDREWMRETMAPAARTALDAYREENGGESA